jgi:predicted naringenin-chalcone synthase
MSIAILGLGTAVPPTTTTQAEACEVARSLCCQTEEQETWLPMLYNNTGIAKRHLTLGRNIVDHALGGARIFPFLLPPKGGADDHGPTTGQRMELYAEYSLPLALQAARNALAESRLPPGDITHLITVSCTGFRAPGVDVELIKRLHLPATTQRTHIGYMGCHAALNAMRVAGAFTGADARARVLVSATELCSLHYHYGWDPQKIVANAIFADGSAAVVGVPVPEAPASAWRVTATGSCLAPSSEDAMTWTIGDHGFEMTLAKKVPQLIASHVRPWLESWLAENGLALDQIGSWAVHPGGPRILEEAAAALGLTSSHTSAAREVFAEYGNMSSPTVLFILERLRSRNAPRPCVALGFGPGLFTEAALIQ